MDRERERDRETERQRDRDRERREKGGERKRHIPECGETVCHE